MVKEEHYKVEVSIPAQIRYQNEVLSYLLKNFNLERALEIDDNIFKQVFTLSRLPNRGRDEELIQHGLYQSKYILYKETRNFEIKIIYYVEEIVKTVYVTDFYATEMNPSKIKDRS